MITISGEKMGRLLNEAIPRRHKDQIGNIRKLLIAICKEHRDRYNAHCSYCGKVHDSRVVCPERAQSSKWGKTVAETMSGHQQELDAFYRDAFGLGIGITRIKPEDFFKRPKRFNPLAWLARQIKYAVWDTELEGLR